MLARMAELNVISRVRGPARERGRSGSRSAPRERLRRRHRRVLLRLPVQYLLADPGLGKTVEERRDLLFSGGLTIKTTIDPRFQRAADAVGARRVSPKDQAIGGLAMVQPGTGEVRALSQSRPMGGEQGKGETYLNYVVPREVRRRQRLPGGLDVQGVRAVRRDQPGHPAVHPDLRAAAGLHPRRTASGPATARPGSTDVWTPQNSTGTGTFDLYTGTQQSVNTFFAQLEERTGLCDPVKLAREMGVTVPEQRRSSARSPSASPTPTR